MCNMPLSDQCGTYFPLPVVKDVLCSRCIQDKLLRHLLLKQVDCLIPGAMAGNYIIRCYVFDVRYCLLDEFRLDSNQMEAADNSMDLLDTRYFLHMLYNVDDAGMGTSHKYNQAFPLNIEK